MTRRRNPSGAGVADVWGRRTRTAPTKFMKLLLYPRVLPRGGHCSSGRERPHPFLSRRKRSRKLLREGLDRANAESLADPTLFKVRSRLDLELPLAGVGFWKAVLHVAECHAREAVALGWIPPAIFAAFRANQRTGTPASSVGTHRNELLPL